ncbi:acyl transferase/acyl hydrolase/lysophospholipase [Ustulina deusta]|nr:acyl transferase/acyl hydrolase/lysophospholipase [Ustulina deusta]
MFKFLGDSQVWSSGRKTPAIAKSNRLEQLTLLLPLDKPGISLILIIGCCQRPPTKRKIFFLLATNTLQKQSIIKIYEGPLLLRSEMAAKTFDRLISEVATPLRNAYLSDIFFLRLCRACCFTRTLFSVRHFNSLFARAFHGVSSVPTFSFDCLQAAREDLPVAPNIASHFMNFLKLIPSSRQLCDFAAPVIASSILLDQYPPGMHLFLPAEVYNKLYSQQVREAASGKFREDLFSGYVLASMEALFLQLVGGRSAAAIHNTVLARYAAEWRTIQSSRSCFTCFTSTPQHFLPCGHSLCENCVQIFGRSQSHDPWLFRLQQCQLCQKPVDLIVRVRPPTAGHAILCIDSGGVRGIIPATVLERIEERLNLPIPVQEHFDLAYGISVGGLVVLGLYNKGWSATTCALKLESLAAEAFRNPGPQLGFFNWPIISKWIHLLLFGRLYSAQGIETALKGVFGNKKMASPSYATTVGTKVGILAASAKQPLTNLFTNYNGIGDARVGYHIPRGCNAIKAWEVARSTSAAPMFFSPKYVPDLGTFQDGGVLRNNPSIVIRLAQAYISLMQGRSTWNDIACLSKKESRSIDHYRLDIALEGEISLDDVSLMPLLRSLVFRDVALKETIEEVAQRLFAALFYFELTACPTPVGSRLRIEGKILCTRKARDSALPQIFERLDSSTILINRKATRFQIIYNDHGNITVPLVFLAGRSFSLEVRQDFSCLLFLLSGSPYVCSMLVSRSSVAASFGTRSYKRKRDNCKPCGRQSQRRRLF